MNQLGNPWVMINSVFLHQPKVTLYYAPLCEEMEFKCIVTLGQGIFAGQLFLVHFTPVTRGADQKLLTREDVSREAKMVKHLKSKITHMLYEYQLIKFNSFFKNNTEQKERNFFTKHLPMQKMHGTIAFQNEVLLLKSFHNLYKN